MRADPKACRRGRMRLAFPRWDLCRYQMVNEMRYEKPETILKPLLVREGAVAMVRSGLPFSMLDEVATAAGVGRLALARVLALSSTTLARRREAGLLTPEEADRLVRVARLIAKAHDMMHGDADAARRWLGAPHALLEGESPLERASTEVGGREVEELIGRLRHGIFS